MQMSYCIVLISQVTWALDETHLHAYMPLFS